MPERRWTPIKLLTKDILNRLPAIDSTEEQGLKANAIIHFYSPGTRWNFYVSEGSYIDEDDEHGTDKKKYNFLFHGLVSGLELELNYFTLYELEELNFHIMFYKRYFKRSFPDKTGIFYFPIERDRNWKPKPLGEIWEEHEKRRNRYAR